MEVLVFGVNLRLLMVMLSCCLLGMPAGTHLGLHCLWTVPTDISPSGANVVARAALPVLTLIERCISATTIRDIEKTRFNTQLWRVLAHPG